MSDLARLREWVSRRDLYVFAEKQGDEWSLRVAAKQPVSFLAESGWQPNPEAAAGKVIELLEEIGEEFD